MKVLGTIRKIGDGGLGLNLAVDSGLDNLLQVHGSLHFLRKLRLRGLLRPLPGTLDSDCHNS